MRELRSVASRRGLGATTITLVALVLLTGCLEADVRYLADDARAGRKINTPGLFESRDHILTYLEAWTDGPNVAATGRERYQQAFDVTAFSAGSNLFGVIPGTDLAHEHVMVGAHYDGLGWSCKGSGPTDSICNGATDNATGVAMVIQLMRAIAFAPEPPRRSIVFAFWDQEEDGLDGSAHYVAHPLIPLAATKVYVNLDIQGSNLRPSLRDTTFTIGAQSGGNVLVDAVTQAAAGSPLDTWMLHEGFGSRRSDHASFSNVSVPTVFLTDSSSPCYHSVDDDIDAVDFTKLEEQWQTLHRLVLDLANRDDAPVKVSSPSATYEDLLAIQTIFHRAMTDLGEYSPADQAAFLGRLAVIDTLVADGRAAFTSSDAFTLLTRTNSVITLLSNVPCNGYQA